MRGAVAVVLLSGAALCAQTPAVPGAVTLDAVVDAGRLREPLAPADFIVSEDGRPLVVSAVRLVQPSGNPAPLAPIASDADEVVAAAAADRLVAVYLDEYHLTAGAAFERAQAAVAGFLRNQLGPRDLVIVLKPLDSLVSLRMSTDRESAARMVEGASGREGDYVPRSTFEQQFIAGAPSRIDAARRQIALSALQALTTHLGRFAVGRKTLLVVSNGLPEGARAPREAALPDTASLARNANSAHVAVYVWKPGGGPSPAAGVTDAGGPSREPLAALAEATTGLVIEGEGDAGLARMRADAGRYYLLSLAQPDGTADGRYRRVNVSVRTAGTHVRARSGYALVPADAGVRAAGASSLPEGLKLPRHTSPLIRTWFGQANNGDGQTRVSFVWEPAARVPGERGVRTMPARVLLTVSTMDRVALFSATAVSSAADASVGGTTPGQLSFSVAPGSALVQMDVLDDTGRVLDHDVRDLPVGGFPGQVEFGTPAVFRGRTLPELRAILAPESTVPPTAARQFGRGERLVVRIPLSSQGPLPTVTAHLLSRFGTLLRELTVSTVTAGDGPRQQVQLALAPFPAGAYTLEFEARSASGAARDRLDFVVTP